jgi:ankyrin repeat protein
MNEIYKLLINGADANTKDVKGYSLLMNYAAKNDLETMSILLEFGASINDKDHLSLSALDYAIENHHLEAVKLLVKNGAAVTNDSYMFAVRKNYRDIVDFFDTLDPDKYIFLKDRKRR